MLLVSLTLSLLVGVGIGQEFRSYVTLPKAKAVTVQVMNDSNPDQLAPGYFFLAPYAGEFAPNFGPQIFNHYGELVWYGNATANHRGFDPKLCGIGTRTFDHLCFNDAAPVEQGGHGSGIIRVFDHSYKEVMKPFGAAGNLRGPDFHELNTDMPSKQSFIQDVFQVVPKNVSAWGGPEHGYILSGCFQEIDWKSRAVKFQWCSHNHVSLEETFVYMKDIPNQKNATGAIAGNGTVDNPWDYFHINSIDKTTDGGYLVSGRHCNAIYHVAGHDSPGGHAPGDIIWRLNGKRPTIKTQNFTFCKQHHVRFHSMTSSKMVLSIFNNAGDGVVSCGEMSSGMLISVDTDAKTASLVKQFKPPAGPGFLANSQGDVQFLGDVSNGNVVIGWGALPFYSEYTNDGKLLYHAGFTNSTGGDSSYRVSKFQWHGKPHWNPTILPYAQTCKGQMYAWASWNGATEVKSWQFYKCAKTTGPCKKGSKNKKVSFETLGSLGTIEEYAYAEAMDGEGKVLGKSKRGKVLVPKASLNCTESKCPDGVDHFDTANSITASCFNDTAADGVVSAIVQQVSPTGRPNHGGNVGDKAYSGNLHTSGHNGTSSLSHSVTNSSTHPGAGNDGIDGGIGHPGGHRSAPAGSPKPGSGGPWIPPNAAPNQPNNGAGPNDSVPERPDGAKHRGNGATRRPHGSMNLANGTSHPHNGASDPQNAAPSP